MITLEESGQIVNELIRIRHELLTVSNRMSKEGDVGLFETITVLDRAIKKQISQHNELDKYLKSHTVLKLT